MPRFKQQAQSEKLRFKQKLQNYLYPLNQPIKTQIQLNPQGIQKLPELQLLFDYEQLKPTLFNKCQIDQNVLI